jgi:hypothetical protein
VEEIIRAASSNQPSPSHTVQQRPHQPQQQQQQHLQQQHQHNHQQKAKDKNVDKMNGVSGLFKTLNISNLDVSFNASFAGSPAGKKRDELNQEKALLIKSFALQGKDRSIRTWNEENSRVQSAKSKTEPDSTKATSQPSKPTIQVKFKF